MSDCGDFGIFALFIALAVGTALGTDPLVGLIVLSILYVVFGGLG